MGIIYRPLCVKKTVLIALQQFDEKSVIFGTVTILFFRKLGMKLGNADVFHKSNRGNVLLCFC